MAHSNRVIILGVTVKGLGESNLFTEIPWVKQQFISNLGFAPHPGTFNLEVKDGNSLQRFREVKTTAGIKIPPQQSGFCSARCYRVILAGWIEGAAVIPEVSGYPESKLEIIASCNVRDSLGVKDGDTVKVEVIVGEERSSTARKEQHVRCCLEHHVESSLTTGFEKYFLVNESLPEVAFDDVDTSCFFLGKKISAPFIISPMTGGTETSAKINKNLAKAAQELGLVMSVGSQKLALEESSLIATYQVRDVAPDIPLLANLGAIYLNYGYGPEECKRAVGMIEADGLVLYLNPLQKIFQGNIHCDFKDLIKKISKVCKTIEVPVVVKEVGFGLSPSTAIMLKEAGVSMIDVAGAGGTSWAKIEHYLKKWNNSSDDSGDRFGDWGIPTAVSLVSVLRAVKGIPVIAAGGIRSGLDMAKAIALGASYVGMGLPLLAPASESDTRVKKKIEMVLHEFKTAMFCCGKKNLEELRKGDCIKEMGR